MNNKQLFFIPLLLLLYYFAHYIFEVYYFIEPVRSLKQFGLYILVTGLCFFTGYIIFKNKQRFTLAFTILLFIFLFFGAFIDTLVATELMAPVTNVGMGLILVFFAAAAVIIFICSRLSEAIVKKLLRFWLIYLTVVLVYDAGSFLLRAKREKKYVAGTALQEKLPSASPKPSVFFLLFDMYPSDTVLKRYLSYDNRAIGSFLQQKGFFVTGDARSLYSETYYSLPSTLGLQPLSFFADSTIEEYKKKLIALKNIQQASVPALFQNSGYAFRNYSVFNMAGQPSPLQFNLNYHLDNVLTASTFFNRAYNDLEPDFFLASRNIDLGFIKNSWSKNVKSDIVFLDNTFKALLDSFAVLKGPSFNYFHFMIPHPPVIYDSSGHENSVRDMYAYNGFERSNQNFTGYTAYANRQIEKMVNTIFEKAGRNTIIIIQGDHGYREFYDRFPDAVRYGVFNAVYLPSANYTGFTDSMTVLETFRLILKNQFAYNAK